MKRRWIGIVIFLLAMARPGAAQPRLFVSGDVIVDVKRFSDNGASTTLSGTTVGGGGEAGVFVTPYWSLGVSLDTGRSTSTSAALPIVLAAPVGVPISSFRSQVTNRLTATSVLVGYHFPVYARMHVGALGGLAFVHVSRDYTTIGPSVLTAAPAALVIRPFTQLDNVAAATVGGELALALSQHAGLIGDLRVHAFSLSSGGPSGFGIRPGLGSRWTF